MSSNLTLSAMHPHSKKSYGERKLHDEARAARTALYRYGPMRALDCAFDDCKAEARAGNVPLRAAIESVEDARGIARRNARTLVCDFDSRGRVASVDAHLDLT